MTLRDRSLALATALAVVGLVVLAAWRHFAILDATPYPVGVDGYFYALQLRSILEHGTLAYPDFPLAFYALAPFAAATDPIVGAKLGSAILGALAILPAYGIGARLGKSRGAGLVAAALVATSAGSTFLAIEFVKNGVGVTVALTAVWLGLRACTHASRRRVVLAIVGLVAAIATHKVAGALVLVVAVPAGLAAASERGELFGRRLLYAIVGLVVAAIAAVFVAGAEGLVGNVLSTTPRWDAPALAQGDVTLLPMGYEALIGLVLAALAATALLAHRTTLTRTERAAAWALVALGLVIGQPFLAVDDPQGLGFRLRVIAFVPMALTAAIVCGALPAMRLRAALLAAIAAILVVALPARRAQGMVIPHPAMVTAVLAMKVPAGETVAIPERQVMFMAAWYTRSSVRLSPTRTSTWRAVTLSFLRTYCRVEPELDAARTTAGIAPPVGLHPSHPHGFVLVPEATWAWVIDQLPDEREQARCRAWPVI